MQYKVDAFIVSTFLYLEWTVMFKINIEKPYGHVS